MTSPQKSGSANDDPRVTITAPVSALIGIHLVADATLKQAEQQGLNIAGDLREVTRTLESALRSHGWAPQPDGTWTQRLPRRRRA